MSNLDKWKQRFPRGGLLGANPEDTQPEDGGSVVDMSDLVLDDDWIRAGRGESDEEVDADELSEVEEPEA